MESQHYGNKEVWITKSSGIVRKVNSDTWSNEEFINTIHSDNSSMSKLMQSRFPTSTTIRTLSGNPPEKWNAWILTSDIDVEYIKNICSKSVPEVLAPEKRLYQSRLSVSDRYRNILSASSMYISPRGIKIGHLPDSINDAVADIVLSLHFLIEKETIASIGGGNSNKITRARSEQYRRAQTIVDNEQEDIFSFILHSAYTQPSVNAMLRLFEVGSVVGVDNVKEIVSTIYRSIYTEQIQSITNTLSYIPYK